MKTRRHLLIALGASFATWPVTTYAQQPARVPRLGLLSPFLRSDTALWHQAFKRGLRELGWVEGQNIAMEYRYAEGKSDRLADLAAEFIRLKVDIIVTSVTTDALAAKKTTRTIPIVMAAAGDPVASGLVESLSRPGGNITGLSQVSPQLAGKRLELLKELVPKLSRVGVLWNPAGTTSPIAWNESQLPARVLGLELHSMEVRSPNDYAKVFEDAAKAGAGAVAIMPDPSFITQLKRIADLSAKSRLPSIFYLAEFVDAGGLVAYGPDRADMFRRAAAYVDKILKGTKPGDLPVEQPSKFELAINLKTARALGLTIPEVVLLRADKVIE